MNIDKKTLKKVADNSRLSLTDKDIEELLPQIKEIIKAFSVIQKAPTDKLEPSFQPIKVKSIFREDKIEECLTQEEALSNTKHKKDGFFKGPKTL